MYRSAVNPEASGTMSDNGKSCFFQLVGLYKSTVNPEVQPVVLCRIMLDLAFLCQNIFLSVWLYRSRTRYIITQVPAIFASIVPFIMPPLAPALKFKPDGTPVSE